MASSQRETSSGTQDRATIEDVAAAAGVSVATVSRAVRDLPNVAPATKARVLEVAEELRYRADPNASRLATGQTLTGAVAVPALNSWYFSQVISGVEAVFTDAGYDMLLIALRDEREDSRVYHHLDRFRKRIDGLILVDVRPDDDELNQLAQTQIPMVTLGHDVPGFFSITNDEQAAASQAMDHLIDLGHKRIGYIGGHPDDRFNFRVEIGRHQAYRDALKAAKIEGNSDYEVTGNFSLAGAADATEALLNCTPRPTAIFVISDEMAMACMKVCRDRGLRVPEDISIVGFDDHDLSHVMDLTTVRQTVVANGAFAARSLLELLAMDTAESDKSKGSVTRPTELVVRGSSGPAPK